MHRESKLRLKHPVNASPRRRLGVVTANPSQPTGGTRPPAVIPVVSPPPARQRRPSRVDLTGARADHDAAALTSALPPATRTGNPAAKARPTAPVLPDVVTLVRVWNGRRHEVTVVEGGRAFAYRGTTYRSLTAVARAITGTEWSGPRYFGLAAKAAKP